MNTELNLKNLNCYLDCQKHKTLNAANELGDVNSNRGFITLSRTAGSGGITISRKVVEMLNANKVSRGTCPWTVFDRNLVKVVLEEHFLPERMVEYMPEAKISEMKDILEEILELHPSQITLNRQTRETILHLAQMGHSIIVGRGANIVTKKIVGGLNVRLIAPLHKRLAHVQEYYHLDESEAAEFIKTEDQGRADYFRANYDKDINDPLLYDLVINTDELTYETAAELIAEAVLKVRNS